MIVLAFCWPCRMMTTLATAQAFGSDVSFSLLPAWQLHRALASAVDGLCFALEM